MLSYELCKQLKEAGFPQKFKPFYSIDNGGEKDQQLAITYPTLSELIEACEPKFYYLTKVITKEAIFWEAYDLIGRSGGKEKTREEVVAKLYLKLNEK